MGGGKHPIWGVKLFGGNGGEMNFLGKNQFGGKKTSWGKEK